MRITHKQTDAFRMHLMEDEKSIHTIEKYMRDIEAFLKWANGRSLDKMTVLAYKEKLISEYAPASVNSMLSSLNSFFAFCGWDTLKVKMLKIQRRIFSEQACNLSKQEYERLLSAAKETNEKLFYIMQTICAVGIRISELSGITAEAIRTGKAEISCKGKRRIILLPVKLCLTLSVYMKRNHIKSGPVFITRNGKPLDRSTIWKMMKSLSEKAHVAREKIFPHNLRHLFARTFYSFTKDIVRLADILGHSGINTTRIYTMESGDVHRRQLEKLGLLPI